MLLGDENMDEFYASGRTLNKTYFSKQFNTKFDSIKKRFAHKLLDEEKNEFILKDEITIASSPNGKRQLKALFFEGNRKIDKLILQQFGDKGNPLKNSRKEASFTGEEIERLYFFLKAIKQTEFPSKSKYNINDTELAEMLLNKQQAYKLVYENFDLIQEALNNNITNKDLINFGYRKNQLEIFKKLIDDNVFFKDYKEKLENETRKHKRDEDIWQFFFEKNTWILGYGLDYIFNSELDSKKIEQVTTGSNFNQAGKRIDGLLKSLGAINSLCFCELKLNSEPLLKPVKNANRGESWQISDTLAGAIAQVQRTIHKAIKGLSTKTEIKDGQDFLTGEDLYLYNPKAFILIGDLNEFIVDEKINEVKFSSFEMFRKNLKNIDIVTYDELYQRAYHICHNKE